MYFSIRNTLETFDGFVTEFFDISSQSGPVFSCGCRRQIGPVFSCARRRESPAGSIDKFYEYEAGGRVAREG